MSSLSSPNLGDTASSPNAHMCVVPPSLHTAASLCSLPPSPATPIPHDEIRPSEFEFETPCGEAGGDAGKVGDDVADFS